MSGHNIGSTCEDDLKNELIKEYGEIAKLLINCSKKYSLSTDAIEYTLNNNEYKEFDNYEEFGRYVFKTYNYQTSNDYLSFSGYDFIKIGQTNAEKNKQVLVGQSVVYLFEDNLENLENLYNIRQKMYFNLLANAKFVT